MRLTKEIRINERMGDILAAESLNVLNWTNYSGVNNEVPTLNGFANIAVNPHAVVSFLPSTPLAFPAASSRKPLAIPAALASSSSARPP
jgi:hypothetical protein